MTPEERLNALDDRLARVERLSYVNYWQLRAVADYAYDLVTAALSEDDERIRRDVKPVRKTGNLSDVRLISQQEALESGMPMEHLVSLKLLSGAFSRQTRRDALALARDIAGALAEIRAEMDVATSVAADESETQKAA